MTDLRMSTWNRAQMIQERYFVTDWKCLIIESSGVQKNGKQLANFIQNRSGPSGSNLPLYLEILAGIKLVSIETVYSIHTFVNPEKIINSLEYAITVQCALKAPGNMLYPLQFE